MTLLQAVERAEMADGTESHVALHYLLCGDTAGGQPPDTPRPKNDEVANALGPAGRFEIACVPARSW